MSVIQRWMDFFLDAGIPDETAATYATNFSNNRMEMSMLTDLSKDYLKELDITLLGDIILILKHAKKVAEKQTQDRVLGDKDQIKNVERNREADPVSRLERKITPVYFQAQSKVKTEGKSGDLKMTKQSSKQELECSKSSVFSRLGGQEEQEAQQREEEEEEEKELKREKKEKKEVIIKRAKIESDYSYKKETQNYLIKAVKLEKQDKHSAFDRLEKSDSTQECRVSSSVEQELNPSRGILKQRGGQKGLGKSKSASGIISLKPVENVKKKARVSFGENDIRCVSPLPGIKSRLGTFRTGAESEDEMSPVDLRQTLSKSYAKSITASLSSSLSGQSVPTKPSPSLSTSSSLDSQGVEPISSVKKKYFIVKTMSDGSKSKVEVGADHPLIKKHRLVKPESIQTAPAKQVRRELSPIQLTVKQDSSSRPASLSRQMISQTEQPARMSMEVHVNQERLREDTILSRDRRGQGVDISRGTRVTERMDVRLERTVRGLERESGGGRVFKQMRMDEETDEDSFQTLAARASKLQLKSRDERMDRSPDSELERRSLSRSRSNPEISRTSSQISRTYPEISRATQIISRSSSQEDEYRSHMARLGREDEYRSPMARLGREDEYRSAMARLGREDGYKEDKLRVGLQVEQSRKRRSQEDYLEDPRSIMKIRLTESSREIDDLELVERRVALKEQRIQRLEKETGFYRETKSERGGRVEGGSGRMEVGSGRMEVGSGRKEVGSGRMEGGKGRMGVRRREDEVKYSPRATSSDGYDDLMYNGDRNQDGRVGRGTMRADQLVLPVGERLSKTRERSRSPVDAHRRYRSQERREEGRLGRDEGTGVRSRLGGKLQIQSQFRE